MRCNRLKLRVLGPVKQVPHCTNFGGLWVCIWNLAHDWSPMGPLLSVLVLKPTLIMSLVGWSSPYVRCNVVAWQIARHHLGCRGFVFGVVCRMCVVISQCLFVLDGCTLVQEDLRFLVVPVCFVPLRYSMHGDLPYGGVPFLSWSLLVQV